MFLRKKLKPYFQQGPQTDIDVFMEKEPAGASLGIAENVSAARIYSWDGRFIAALLIYWKHLLQLSKA